MKSSKVWKIIWIGGIYILLFVILYLVVLYKVEWEYKDLNTYLYLYDCSYELCSSTINQDKYYNRILCEDGVCPYIDEIIDNNLILRNNNVSWIYNYVTGEIVNNRYIDYRYIGNDMYVVGDRDNKYGVISNDGTILVDVKYPYIDDYNNNYISYMENGLYGILNNDDDTYIVSADYKDIVLLNNNIFAGLKDNVYQLYSYENGDVVNSNRYDYIYMIDNVIFVVNNKKIDILDINFNSTLLMKLDSFYEYKVEKERDSLRIYSDGINVYFRVYSNDVEYVDYIYSIKYKKLYKF